MHPLAAYAARTTHNWETIGSRSSPRNLTLPFRALFFFLINENCEIEFGVRVGASTYSNGDLIRGTVRI
jgi:hypothetical protein